MSDRQPAPALEFRCPDCPMCGDETWSEAGDRFICDHCRCYWDRDGEFCDWDEPDTPQCDSTDYNRWSKKTHRCILTAGHDGDHENGVVVGWREGTLAPGVTDE